VRHNAAGARSQRAPPHHIRLYQTGSDIFSNENETKNEKYLQNKNRGAAKPEKSQLQTYTFELHANFHALFHNPLNTCTMHTISYSFETQFVNQHLVILIASVRKESVKFGFK